MSGQSVHEDSNLQDDEDEDAINFNHIFVAERPRKSQAESSWRREIDEYLGSSSSTICYDNSRLVEMPRVNLPQSIRSFEYVGYMYGGSLVMQPHRVSLKDET